jgi:hypothetical protein
MPSALVSKLKYQESGSTLITTQTWIKSNTGSGDQVLEADESWEFLGIDTTPKFVKQ